MGIIRGRYHDLEDNSVYVMYIGFVQNSPDVYCIKTWYTRDGVEMFLHSPTPHLFTTLKQQCRVVSRKGKIGIPPEGKSKCLVIDTLEKSLDQLMTNEEVDEEVQKINTLVGVRRRLSNARRLAERMARVTAQMS